MKFFCMLLLAITANVFMPLAKAADFFEAMGEYRNGILYLPRVNVDFLANDVTKLQLQPHENGRWYLKEYALENKQSDVTATLSNNRLTIPLAQVVGDGSTLYCNKAAFTFNADILFLFLDQKVVMIT